MLDNVPGTWNMFTNAVKNEVNLSWVSDDKRINTDALKSLTITTDPNYPGPEARQTYSQFGPSEQWADAFGNYVAGNIDLSDAGGPGPQMYNFVYNALVPCIGLP